LKAEAAAVLGLPVDADRVVMLAALKLQHQTMLESLVAGRNTDADALLAITRAISELLPPAGPKIPEVKIEIVDTLVGICSKCGHEHRPYQPPVEGARPTVEPSPPRLSGGNQFNPFTFVSLVGWGFFLLSPLQFWMRKLGAPT
jgi:hypothetical protein